jgi:hypothetical protein
MIVGRYLDILKRTHAERGGRDKSDQSDQSFPPPYLRPDFGRLCRFGRTLPAFAKVFDALERGCPEGIEVDHWQQAIKDSRRFLARWGEKAAALGWTARELFGLHAVPDNPAPNYRRLSRYDETGLIWLLRGRPVVALTANTAAIENPTGAVNIYRKNNKPALGPTGDSLDDFHDAPPR